jgi:hypothetical protein
VPLNEQEQHIDPTPHCEDQKPPRFVRGELHGPLGIAIRHVHVNLDEHLLAVAASENEEPVLVTVLLVLSVLWSYTSNWPLMGQLL